MICRGTEKRDRKLEIKKQQPIAIRNRLLLFMRAEKERGRAYSRKESTLSPKTAAFACSIYAR